MRYLPGHYSIRLVPLQYGCVHDETNCSRTPKPIDVERAYTGRQFQKLRHLYILIPPVFQSQYEYDPNVRGAAFGAHRVYKQRRQAS